MGAKQRNEFMEKVLGREGMLGISTIKNPLFPHS